MAFFDPTPTVRIWAYKLALVSVCLSLCLRAPVFLQNSALEVSNFLQLGRTWIGKKIIPSGFSTQIHNRL